MEGRRLIFVASSAQPLKTSFTVSFSSNKAAAVFAVYTKFGRGILYRSRKTDPVTIATVPAGEINQVEGFFGSMVVSRRAFDFSVIVTLRTGRSPSLWRILNTLMAPSVTRVALHLVLKPEGRVAGRRERDQSGCQCYLLRQRIIMWREITMESGGDDDPGGDGHGGIQTKKGGPREGKPAGRVGYSTL
eukprot:Gb_31976 [translate_table: standard]